VLLVFPSLLLATTNTTPRRAFYLGLIHGIIGYGTALYWLFNIFAAAAIALFCLLHNYFAKQTNSATLKLILAPMLWTALEFYRSELFFLSFPWITPGSALGPTYLSPIVGVYGASFLVVAASAGFVHRRTAPLAVFLSVCVLSLGLFRPGKINAPGNDEGINVTVVQSEASLLESYVALTKTVREESPDLIVWPEYALPYDVRKNADEFATLTNLCAKMDAILVVGTQTAVGPGARDWHNTALTLDGNGVLGEHHKARPVHFFNDGIPGRSFQPIQTGLGTFGTPICFDCDYSDVARQMVQFGAEYFAVPSFDAESWSATQHWQHALLFRLRAAETGRWFACAASSGVSQFIDPNGNVHKSLPPMKTGVLTQRIGRSTHATLFLRAGWLFPWLTLAGTIALFTFGVVRLCRPRKPNQPYGLAK